MAKTRRIGTQTEKRLLTYVQEFVPETERVVDATADLPIEVTARDAASRAVKNHKDCALAVACKRLLNAKVVISRSRAYVIEHGVATRYELQTPLVREITSFDRGGGFAPGEYRLCKIREGHKQYSKKDGGGKYKTGQRPKRREIAGLRLSLATKRDA